MALTRIKRGTDPKPKKPGHILFRNRTMLHYLLNLDTVRLPQDDSVTLQFLANTSLEILQPFSLHLSLIQTPPSAGTPPPPTALSPASVSPSWPEGIDPAQSQPDSPISADSTEKGRLLVALREQAEVVAPAIFGNASNEWPAVD